MKSKKQLFEGLASNNMDDVYSKAIRLTGSAEKAEILVQKTYAHAFNAFEKFDKNADFNKWLIALLILVFVNSYTPCERRPPAIK